MGLQPEMLCDVKNGSREPRYRGETDKWKGQSRLEWEEIGGRKSNVCRFQGIPED